MNILAKCALPLGNAYREAKVNAPLDVYGVKGGVERYVSEQDAMNAVLRRYLGDRRSA